MEVDHPKGLHLCCHFIEQAEDEKEDDGLVLLFQGWQTENRWEDRHLV